MIFLDASALLAALDRADPEHRAARALLTSGRRLATLDLAVYEGVNVATTRWRSARLAEGFAAHVWAIRDHGVLVTADERLASGAAQLAAEHGLSVYDASYVVAARRLGAQLVSRDVADLVRPGFAVTPSDALGEPPG